jgi:hypothetical protein
MKKNLWVAFLLAFFCSAANADTIATWNFEVNTPADLSNSSTIGSINADIGSGVASGFHASATTDWTTPSGNGSINSLSANEWAIGDYIQFNVSTLGFQGVSISWEQTSSGTGPGEFKLSYRVGAGSFVDVQDYVVLPNSATAPGLGFWNTATPISGYGYSVNLAAFTALDNAASVDFRFVVRTNNDSTPPGTFALAGTSRFDNVNVTASAVPEPTSAGLLALTGVAGLAFRRRRS